jgi:hypothetical protein
MHGREEKCIQCTGAQMLRQEPLWSGVEEEEDLFLVLMLQIFLYRTQHSAGERKFCWKWEWS